MSGITMSKGVNVSMLGNARRLQCRSEGATQTAGRYRPAVAAKIRRREHPFRRTMRSPLLAHQFQSPEGHGDITIFVTLAVNVKHHAATIDVRDSQLRAFQ